MHRIIKTVCAIAAEDIGRDKADIIAKIAQKRYEELLLENKSDSKALRAHSFKRIYPSIAVYESLKSAGIESEKAVWYIREYFQRFSAKTVPNIQRLIRVLRVASKMPKLFFKIAVKNFGEDAGYGNLHPKLIWGRTKTIGRGGDCCNFLLEYKE